MAQDVVTQCRGLRPSDNQLNAPDGSLSVADNCVVRYRDIIESRRGQARYQRPFDGGANFESHEGWFFEDVLLIDLSDGTLWADNGVNFVQVSSALPPPAPTVLRKKFAEMGGNLYYTTSTGISLLTSPTVPAVAGVQRPLGVTGANVSPNGWQSPDSAVAYRATLALRDDNGNLKEGPPTGRFVLKNLIRAEVGGLVRSGGATVTVTLDPLDNHRLNPGDEVTLAPGEADFAAGVYVVATTANAYTFTYADAGANVASTAVQDFEATRSAQLVVGIPSTTTTQNFVRLYRSDESATAATPPEDELFLAAEQFVTSTDISNGYVTINDATPADFLGADLYTNPNGGEGAFNENDPPPLAKDICRAVGRMFYWNTQQKARRIIQLLGITIPIIVPIAGLVRTGGTTVTATLSAGEVHNLKAGDTFALSPGEANFAAGTKTVATIVDAATFTYAEAGANVASTAEQTLRPVASASNTGLRNGDRLFITGPAALNYYDAKESPSVAADYQLYTDGTPSQNIERTALALIAVVNADSTNANYLHYVSGPEDPPGKILVEERAMGGTSAAFTVYSTSRPSAWSGLSELESDGSTVQGAANQEPNAAYYSKRDQAEAVPLLNKFLVGSKGATVLRGVEFRDKQFVFLKSAGVWTVSGEQPPFRVDPLDLSINLIAADSVVVHANRVWALTDQGVVAISDSGAEVKSLGIEAELLDLMATALAEVKRYAFAVSYESERLFILYLPSAAGDTCCTQAYVYSSAYDDWTHWTGDRTWGRVNKATDLLYLGEPDAGPTGTLPVREERKALDRTDYADEAIPVDTIDVGTAGTTVVVAMSSPYAITDIEDGDLLIQDEATKAVVVSVDTANSRVTVASTENWSIGDPAEFQKAIACEGWWSTRQPSAPGILNQFRELKFHFRRFSARVFSALFDSEVQEAEGVVPLNRDGFGLDAFGSNSFGDTANRKNYRAQVTKEHQRSSQIRVGFRVREARALWAINGFTLDYEPVGERTGK
jgi:hypothetical protein